MNTWAEIVEDIIAKVNSQEDKTNVNMIPTSIHNNQTLMNPSTDTSLVAQINEEHSLIVQDPHEIMIIQHNLPTLPPEHRELMDIDHNTALENISEHTDLMTQSAPNSLVASSQDVSLVVQTV
ncbi:hypothetical protein KC711_01940 [Candidatus Peregrinibacteria bacterium]|nr:hypothetical protein [Candidatus Peregrinibacteria bacterium]